MSDPIRGSIEVKWGLGPNDESRGLAVAKVTVDAVQMLLEQVHGFGNVQVVEPLPPTYHEDGTVDYPGEIGAERVWTAIDARQRPVRVILWRDPDINETLIGQIIQMVTQGTQEEGGA